MLEFLKYIISLSKQQLTILLWEGSRDHAETFLLVPRRLLGWLLASYAVLILVMCLIFYLTPLGTLLFNHEDRALREQVVEIYTRVDQLSDSLAASEYQLSEFKRALAEGIDTTFSITAVDQNLYRSANSYNSGRPYRPEIDPSRGVRGLLSDEIIFSNRMFFDATLEFPLRFPLGGSLTRRFDADNGHYGIDIAAEEGAPVRSFASGVVLFSGFTLNYGAVVMIQHQDAFVSVYKHCNSLTIKPGDFIGKGDVIGRVSDSGRLSSGPHLHLELWQNGLPLNPEDYFSNFN